MLRNCLVPDVLEPQNFIFMLNTKKKKIKNWAFKCTKCFGEMGDFQGRDAFFDTTPNQEVVHIDVIDANNVEQVKKNFHRKLHIYT